MGNLAEDKQKRRKKLIRVLYLLFFTIVIGLVLFISRGPHISNALKTLILPELEAAFGQTVLAQKIYINIFPLFIEAKGVKVFDESGNRILSAKRVKGYVELPGLLSKRLSIRKLVIKEPDISTDREKIIEVVKHFKAYLEEERKQAIKVGVKIVEITDGTVSFRDDTLESLIGVSGLKGEVILGKDLRLKMSGKTFDIEKEGWPDLTGDFDTSLVLRNDEIQIKSLKIGSYGSDIKASGFYSKGKGTVIGDIDLLVDSVKRIFGLKQRGEGGISAKGEVRFEGLQQWENISIDLKLKGDFYIQTLMEFLKVKEPLEGIIDFNGEIKGNLSDIAATGKARLKNGTLFGVGVDTLRCDVTYKDKVMRFNNMVAELYRGEARAELSLTLPRVTSFNLAIAFHSIDSRPAFMLIGWEPEIPAGKVDGELVSSGSEFRPEGWFSYTSRVDHTPSTVNVLGRIKKIKGHYALRGGLLSLSTLHVSTSLSDLTAEGSVDINKKNLNFTVRLDTKEVSDLTLPFYSGLKGKGNFHGGITGTIDNPGISGSFDIADASVEGYRASRITSRFSYNKNLLNVHELLVMAPEEDHRIRGKIVFPEAKNPFEFSKPVYEMNAAIKNADLGELMKRVSTDPPLKGRLHADFKVGGRESAIEIVGNATIEKAAMYTIPFDSASIAFSYLNNELSFKKAIIRWGTSILTAEGRLSSDGKFSYKAVSDKILIKEIGLERIPVDASLSILSEGHGTVKDPTITLSAKVERGTFKGRSIGSSSIDASIKNREISLHASLFDNKMRLRGKGHLDDPLPWNAEVDIQPGRYDFIYGSVLKDIPEDLSLSFGGHIDMKGDKKHITVSAHISRLTLSLFGYSLSNDFEIKVQVENKRLSLPTFTLKGTDSSLRCGGDIEIGRAYNLFLEGRSSLVPLKGLSKKIEHLSGEADVSFSIKGKAEKPEMSGYLKISNAALGLKGYQQRISAINGTVSIDKDRIVVKKISGKTGGGDIDLSGLVYYKAFDITRFYFESTFGDITASISKDFVVTFRGNLLYKGTPDAQGISGDIEIKSAKYKEKIEWQKLLLASKTKELPRTEVSGFERAKLNVRISGSDNISIDNNIARAPVTVDIVVKGTVSRPVLLGRLESKEGIFYFRNNEFKVIHASADFVDPNKINPLIELAATTGVSNYTIKLNLEGQLERFNLSLSSDPPLEEMEILSLLTVGYVGKRAKGGVEGGISAGEAASFLTGRVQDVITERVRTITGFERVRIDPSVSKTTGTVGSRVTVSKRLADDRLYVTYTMFVGSTDEQVLKLEYFLSRNISLIGIRDETGSVGGDIKFRFEFK
jgi:translocation and assembly module TamB